MPLETRQYRLDGDRLTLFVTVFDGVPAITYWGPRLSADADPAVLAHLAEREEAPASPAQPIPIALTPMAGQGHVGRPGLACHRAGRDWAVFATVTSVETGPASLRLSAEDTANGIAIEHQLAIEGDLLVATTTLINTGTAPLQVDHLAAPVLPLPPHLTRLLAFEGRWSGEFQLYEVDRPTGCWLQENRRGRTSHDRFPGVLLAEPACNEQHGLAYGVHLGWSGNHRLVVETLADGHAQLFAEPLFLPGELILAPGDRYRTPALYAAVSDAGLSGLSQCFHRHLRARPQHARLRARPRPVHYNCWEAIYFNHDPDKLLALAERAAAVGAERFVLDDGWFLGRRNDRAGLGDWRVDPAIYPNGLAPLIDRVESLGMEFGLWVEPEMVNPDSDLFRAHPEWVLATPPAPAITYRNQLVLDFGRPDVREHLFQAIDALLRDHRIAYLKWDMNSDLPQPGDAAGRAGVEAHVRGVYQVLDRLRAAWPLVEIESCASGGGRADYGILARTDRIWTSDSNDALDRQLIQRGFSHFFPPEVMGAHVGPNPCHITGRTLSMALRVQTAMFGHMGMELDLDQLDPDDFALLRAGIALHKRHRRLIHTGDLVRLDAEPGVVAFGMVAPDRSEALFSTVRLTEQRGYYPQRLRLAGLDPARRYRVQLVWPEALQPRSTLTRDLLDGLDVTGDVLMQHGLQPPRQHPQTGFVLQLTGQPD